VGGAAGDDYYSKHRRNGIWIRIYAFAGVVVEMQRWFYFRTLYSVPQCTLDEVMATSLIPGLLFYSVPFDSMLSRCPTAISVLSTACARYEPTSRDETKKNVGPRLASSAPIRAETQFEHTGWSPFARRSNPPYATNTKIPHVDRAYQLICSSLCLPCLALPCVVSSQPSPSFATASLHFAVPQSPPLINLSIPHTLPHSKEPKGASHFQVP
jgi:hypothetical protein